MARYPGAVWKPISSQYLSGRRMAVYNRMNLHVAVSEAASLHGFFNAKGRASSHFYVRKDGAVEQYVDTAYQAEADLDGNDATISVETQGGLRNAQSEPWTQAQVVALAGLFAWAVKTHGIPARLARDSRPGESSKGLSWHRLGIDPWRVSGGMKYSNARGKVCPGDAKIAQIPTVLAVATATLAGRPIDIGGVLPDVPTTGLPDPLTTQTTDQEDVMFLIQRDGKSISLIAGGGWRGPLSGPTAQAVQAAGVPLKNLSDGQYDIWLQLLPPIDPTVTTAQILAAVQSGGLEEDTLVPLLAPVLATHLAPLLSLLPDADVERIAEAVNDEASARLAAR